MNGGDSRGQRITDQPVLLVLIPVLAVAALAVIWMIHGETLSRAYATLRYAEMWVLYAFDYVVSVPGISHVAAWIDGLCNPSGVVGLCTADFKKTTISDIIGSTAAINAVFLIVIAVVAVWMHLAIQRTHPKLLYVGAHTVDSYIEESKEQYAHLKLFSHLDLTDVPLDDARFGMSQTSKQFAAHHKLIAGWQDKGDGAFVPSIDRERATRIFVEQLGPIWTDELSLSAAETILAAITMPRVAATDSTLSTDVFKTALADSESVVAWAWAVFSEDPRDVNMGEVDLDFPREVISRYARHPAVKACVAQHAYRSTVLYRLVLTARRLGVLHAADMRWMRFHDRTMWYVLQNIGRRAAFAEGAAAHCHFMYEAVQREAIMEPQVDKAVSSLAIALHRYRFETADVERYGSVGPGRP